MALLANGINQKGRGSSLKKEKGKRKKKRPKPDNVCCNCGSPKHWRNQPVCSKCKK